MEIAKYIRKQQIHVFSFSLFQMFRCFYIFQMFTFANTRGSFGVQHRDTSRKALTFGGRKGRDDAIISRGSVEDKNKRGESCWNS